MIIDRTSEFIKLRQSINETSYIECKLEENLSVVIMTKINCKFEIIERWLKELSIKQKKQYLPGFSMRGNIKNVINSLKVDISLSFQDIEKVLEVIKNSISNSEDSCLCFVIENKMLYNEHNNTTYIKDNNNECSSLCKEFFNVEKIMLKNILYHYTHKYSDLIKQFRQLQEIQIGRNREFAVFDELENKVKNSTDKSQGKQLTIQKNNEKSNEIEKTVFNLTTMLIELKNHIFLQDLEIDNIELQIDRINGNLEKTNVEIEKFAENYDILKDRGIISMFFIIFALLIALFFKNK